MHTNRQSNKFIDQLMNSRLYLKHIKLNNLKYVCLYPYCVILSSSIIVVYSHSISLRMNLSSLKFKETNDRSMIYTYSTVTADFIPIGWLTVDTMPLPMRVYTNQTDKTAGNREKVYCVVVVDEVLL